MAQWGNQLFGLSAIKRISKDQPLSQKFLDSSKGSDASKSIKNEAPDAPIVRLFPSNLYPSQLEQHIHGALRKGQGIEMVHRQTSQ